MRYFKNSLVSAFIGCFSFLSTEAFAAVSLGSIGTSMGTGSTAGTASTATASSGASDFSGGYIGANIGVQHQNAKINNVAFAGSGMGTGIYGGYGTMVSKAYIGGELEVDYNTTLTKKAPDKLRATYGVSLAGRIGMVIAGNILPYFRLGFGLDGYNYFESTTKIKLKTFAITPGIGIEGLLGQNFLLRGEVAYSLPVTVSGISKSLVKEKPKRAIVRVGGAYKF
jgi:hypothetical protein